MDCLALVLRWYRGTEERDPPVAGEPSTISPEWYRKNRVGWAVMFVLVETMTLGYEKSQHQYCSALGVYRWNVASFT